MMERRSLVRFTVVICFLVALLLPQVASVRSDFTSFYTAAAIARTQPTRLYDQDLQFDIQRRMGKSGYLPFAYPPVTALIFVPLSGLEFESAYFAWLVVSLVLLVASLILLTRRLALSASQSDALLLFTLLFFPIYAALAQGQLTMVVLLFFALFVTEEENWLAGLWAGLLLVKPQLALVPFLILLLSRNWRGLEVGLATGGGQALVSIALVGFSGLRRGVAVLGEMSSNSQILAWLPRMHNLRQLSWFLGTRDAGYFALAGLVVLAFSIAWLRHGRSKWTMFTAVLVACLASPHLFLHDLGLLIVAGAILISMRRAELGYLEQIAWAAGGLLALLGLYAYPIASGLMLAGFVLGTIKSMTGWTPAPGRRPDSAACDLTEVNRGVGQ